MLRIALIAQDFSPHVGGTHVYNVEYARRLAALGHDLKVFTWEEASEAGPAGVELPFEVHRAQRMRGRGGLRAEGIEQALVRWRSDVALVSGSAAAMCGAIRAASRRAPVTVTVHDLRDKGRVRGSLRRWRTRRRYGYDRATRVAATSLYNRGCLLRLGVAEEKIAIVHPGVDTRLFVPDPESGAALRRKLGVEEHRILLTVSRLAPNKGHERVIDTLPRLRGAIPKLRYLIVGAGAMRATLEQHCAVRGVAELVSFVGHVSDVRPFYNACDVYVMPSTPTAGGLKAGEGFGIAYAEAGACGKPAVGSSSGGAPEIVLDGETGHIVDPDDDDQLTKVLEDLLREPERARALGEKGRQHVMRYDWSRGVLDLERVLQEAVSDS